jgi:hypothetical protein
MPGTEVAQAPERLHSPRLASKAIEVDREAGILYGVSVIERGPAIGHGWDVDDVLLDQVIEHGNLAPRGVKTRYTHPDECHDGLGQETGRTRNFRRNASGERVLADLHLLQAAAKSPQGDLRTWVLDMAEEDPGQIGISIAFKGDLTQRLDPNGEPIRDDRNVPAPPVMRLKVLKAADIVDTPAANRQGLFGRAELSARATELLDTAFRARPGLRGPLAERDFAELLSDPELQRLRAGRFAAGAYEISLTADAEQNLDRAAAFCNKYLDNRGITHEPVDPDMLIRLLNQGSDPMKDPVKDDDKKIEPATTAVATPAQAGGTASDGVAAENKRIRELRALKAMFPTSDGVAKLVEAAMDDPSRTVDDVRQEALAAIAKDRDAAEVSTAEVTVGETDSQKFITAASDAICLAQNVGSFTPQEHDRIRGTGLAALGPKQIGRMVLRMQGVRDVDRLSDDELFARLMGQARVVAISGRGTRLQASAHSSGDFPLILANVANKALIVGYETAPITWRAWCRIGNLRDFKTHDRNRLSEAPLLVKRTENMPAEQGTFSEKREQITLDNYAKAFSYSRQMFVNDDLGAFIDVGTRMGRGGAYTIERLVYENLLLNSATGPTMSDSNTLFHANHANLETAAAPSQSSIETMMQNMMQQVGIGEDGAKIPVGGPPRFFLAGPKLAIEINSIIKAPFRITGPTGTDPRTGQSIQGPQDATLAQAQAIAVPQLINQGATTAWYGVADQGLAPSYEVGFLNGNQTPRIQAVIGTTVDGTTIVVDLDFAIFPTGGWQGIHRNPGQ